MNSKIWWNVTPCVLSSTHCTKLYESDKGSRAYGKTYLISHSYYYKQGDVTVENFKLYICHVHMS